MPVIEQEDVAEFINDIVSQFEKLLESKNLEVSCYDKPSSEPPWKIDGADYTNLEERIEDVLKDWGFIY